MSWMRKEHPVAAEEVREREDRREEDKEEDENARHGES